MRKAFRYLPLLSPFEAVRDQLLTVQGSGKYADAAFRLWQARAEAGVAIWNRENPDSPITIEAWAARYPVEIVSERSTDSQPGARALSQFAGARARTADLARLSLAQEAEASGVAAEQIRLETGWHRGVDRAWRFELDDSEACLGPQVLQRQQQASAELKAALAALNARADELRSQVRAGELSPEAAEQAYEEARAPVLVLQDRLQPLLAIAPGAMRGLAAGATRRLDEVLFHPALFAAYPELAALEVRGFDADPFDETQGYFDGRTLHVRVSGATADHQLDVIIHELQHAIQHIEGFAPGGMVEYFKDISLVDQLTAPVTKRLHELLDSDPEFGRLKRLQHRTFSSIIGAYGTDQARGRALDWDQVPDAEREAYFGLGEQLQAFEQYWEYMDLEDQRSRIERDRPVLSAVEQYRRLAGEVEARNTVSRRRLNAATRQATPPEQTEDIARDLQAVDIPGRRPRLAADQAPDGVRVLSQSAALPAATLREMNLQRWSTERPALRASDGSLQVLYHGTQAGEALTHFIPGGVEGVQLTGDAYGVASYFTSSPGEASAYGTDGAVFPVYIRGEVLDLAAPELPAEEVARLSAFANEVLLPADRARFPVGRRERRFTEEQLEDAKTFFQSCRDSWQRLGDGMERARPEVDKDGDDFIVRFTDFDAQVEIRTGEQAHTLFKAIGWDNLPAAGYDGMVMTREGGQRWVVMHRPSGNVKSAIGNSGEFNGFDPHILHQVAGGGVERGQIRIGRDLSFQIALFEHADASTFIHESAHAYLEILRDMAARTRAADSQLRRDWQTVKEWLGIAALGDNEPIPEQAHEQFARGWEAYMREGIAPNADLQGVFERFSEWLCEIYRSIRDLFVELTPEVVEVMDRMLDAGDQRMCDLAYIYKY